jgi:hypothetical protein
MQKGDQGLVYYVEGGELLWRIPLGWYAGTQDQAAGHFAARPSGSSKLLSRDYV